MVIAAAWVGSRFAFWCLQVPVSGPVEVRGKLWEMLGEVLGSCSTLAGLVLSALQVILNKQN